MTVKSWNAQGVSQNLADAVGIMAYTGSKSLKWVGGYTGSSCSKNECPLCESAKVKYPCSSVPPSAILAGLGGNAAQADLDAVCSASFNGKGLGGYMVWFASADNGFTYDEKDGGDARAHHIKWNCKAHSDIEFI